MVCSIWNMFKKASRNFERNNDFFFLLNFEGKSKLFQYICWLSSCAQSTLYKSPLQVATSFLPSEWMHRVQCYLAPLPSLFPVCTFMIFLLFHLTISANIQGLQETVSESNFPVLEKMWFSRVGPRKTHDLFSKSECFLHLHKTLNPKTFSFSIDVFFICPQGVFHFY